MDKLYIWKINGLELDLDMEDADTAERYSSAVRILAEADEIRNKDIDYSSAIRQYCAIFLKFYDFLFGDGIKDNTRKYDAVYDSLISFISKQCEVSCNRMDEITKHYAPKKAKK